MDIQHLVDHGQSFSTVPTATAWPQVKVFQGPRLLVGKEGVALAAWHGHVLSVGGYTGQYSTDSVFEMSPYGSASTPVRQIAILPQRTHDSAAGVIGSSLYVFGGGQADSYSTVLHVMHGHVDAQTPLSRPLSDASSVPLMLGSERGLLLLGGYDGNTFNTTVRFYSEQPDGQLASKELFLMPVGLRYTALATDQSSVWWAGGLSPSGQPTTAIYCWRIGHRVEVIGHLPTALQKAAAFVWKGQYLIVAGGFHSDGLATRDIWAVRLRDGRVRRAGELPIPLADMGYVQMSQFGVVVGGSTGQAMNLYLYRLVCK